MDVDGLPDPNAGPGVDGSAGFAVADWLELRGGIQYEQHSVGESSGPHHIVVPFFEPRFMIRPGAGRWSAFLAPRAGWLRHSFDLLDRQITGTGRVVGGLGGVAFSLSSAVALDVAVVYYHGTVDDVEVDGEPFSVSVEDLSADVTGMRAGLSWRPW